jgi:hypothetical protein
LLLQETLRWHPKVRNLAAVKPLEAAVWLPVTASVIRKHLLVVLLLLLKQILLLLRLLLMSCGCQCSPCRDRILRHLVPVLHPGRPEVGRHVTVGIVSRRKRCRTRQP